MAGEQSESSASKLNANLPAPVQYRCLPTHDGFLSARLSGSLDLELNWHDAQLSCTGSIRPNGLGVRVRFSAQQPGADTNLVLLFGIADIREGETARARPVNLTIMREGMAEFYATQGDARCLADDVQQTPIAGPPLRQRSWRIVVRGFCTQPARALQGAGAVLVSRFDFAGRVDFVSEEMGAQ